MQFSDIFSIFAGLISIYIMESSSEKALSYDAAMAELERLVAQLQSPECPVDKLCDLTKRAIRLLKFCKEKLTGTDRELAELLDHLDESQED
jgi:exodeoxyribonuclease VII small subunit